MQTDTMWWISYRSTTIFIEASPLADAGPDSVICEGDNFTFDASETSASNYSSFSWTTIGNGIFTNPSTLAPTYIPGTTDISAGQVTLRLTANPNSSLCNSCYCGDGY